MTRALLPPSRGGLRTSALAAASNVPVSTVRYYALVGLLPEQSRTPRGHRRFEPAAVEHLWFIRCARQLGLQLPAIAELLLVRKADTCPCMAIGQVVHRQMEAIDRELMRLTAIRDQLIAEAAAAQCEPSQQRDSRPSCPAAALHSTLDQLQRLW
ncbi:MerR family transcriptional regulator [Dactylosporangium sp. CA-092794]|uniref:MerR family transcriptional regulator n=1 Tax=Dactylosporangium sp. CA-092794 TaxID=3239929 RepID=UPI003D9019A0